MRKGLSEITVFLLVLITLLMVAVLSTAALEWDGDSAGGGGHGTPAGPNGYAIRYVDNRNLLGYRFSVVDKSGANKVAKVIDVFRNTDNAPYASQTCDRGYKFSTKYNKKQLIANQNGNYATSRTNVNCYKEEDMDFATELPVPEDMGVWQNYATNINKILSKLGIGSISNLKNGDKILVEPIYDIRLESVYHALTVTETAIYGKYLLGADSDGGASSTSESWGFISTYVNKYYPNSLFTPDGQGLWDGVSAASKRIKFKDIINKGYGVAIAYTETKSDFEPTLSVEKCEAYKGISPMKTYHYGTSSGNAFSHWTLDRDYPKYEDSVFFSVYFPKESENIYVKQTVWIDGTLIGSRSGYSQNLEWYNVSPSVTTVSSTKLYYYVRARVDWIETDGTVKKTGTEKTFYIPIKPILLREQVTVYNEEGEVQAYSGRNGSSGKMYFGQCVNFKYTYGATTAWQSYDNVSATVYRWLGSDWSAIYGSGEDLKKEGVYLYSSQDKSYNSELGDHVIPLPESDKGYEYLFLMMTAWRTDASHTTEYSSYYIPIVKSDVEIVDMKLVDKDGYYADRNHLTPGDVMTVHYFYKNNTDCTVYVKGYNDDMSQIPGIFAIPAGETIEVEGASHTVPNELSYNIWGGVYLSTVSIFDTDYESDGSNNANFFPCQTGVSMSLTAIAPNAPYRETTEVISTFRAWNHASSDILPNNEVYARIRVYKKDETTPFVEMTKKVVSPGDGSNIVYFKWTVPSGLGGNSVTVKGDLFRGDYYWSETSDERATIPFTVYQTPDTQYEENAPSGFTIPNAGISSGYAMQWSEYVHDGYSGLVKRTYRVGLNVSSHDSVSPALTGIAESHDNGWIMKSGYGITVLTRTNLSNKYGAVLASSASYTLPQYVYALYPEYGYAFGTGTATTLERYYSSATYAYYRLPVNGEYGRVHFTPLWYPDGAYQIKVVQSDCWTPVGMINLTIPEKVITISGSAYDDWYAGRRNR